MIKRPTTPDEFRAVADRFKVFLGERGSEILVCTNDYELIRFTTPTGVGIVYFNGAGSILEKHWQNGALDAFKAFAHQLAGWRVTKRQSKRGRSDRVVRALLDRDGHTCFYCRKPFSDLDPPTREHFVAVTCGGPDHLANLALAHHQCNAEVGHLPVVEKIEYAIRKRIEAGELSAKGRPDGTAYVPLSGGNDREGNSGIEGCAIAGAAI